MSLFKNYFNHREKISDIIYEDVLEYFVDEKPESDKIEYKSFVDDENEKNKNLKDQKILKSICGFLNSEGGLIIWGAPKGLIDPLKNGKKIFQGNLSMVELSYDKDSFINKVTDSITPAPKGILFHKIEKNKKFVYIIEIPKSEYSPHQFKDIYYMRLDGQTRPAPHHYIEALMRKIRFPNLVGYIKIENYRLVTPDKSELSICVCIYNLSKLQNDYNLSYRLLCSNGKFRGWDDVFLLNTNKEIRITDQGRIKEAFAQKEVIHYGEPLLFNSQIEFDRNELYSNGYESEIILFFGAKYSPMRASSYKIKLGPIIPENPQNCIKEAKENQYMYEIKEQKGISDRQAISAFLGRSI